MPIVLGASVVGLIAQDKKNAMGAALLYGGAARLFVRLPIGATGEGLRGQDSRPPPQENEGKHPLRTLIVYAHARAAPRALVGGGGD